MWSYPKYLYIILPVLLFLPQGKTARYFRNLPFQHNFYFFFPQHNFWFGRNLLKNQKSTNQKKIILEVFNYIFLKISTKKKEQGHVKSFSNNMQITVISKERHAMHIHFIPVHLEPSAFKKEEAAQPPTPPKCLAFLAGSALPWPAQTIQSPRPRSPTQDLERVGKWSKKGRRALIVRAKRYRHGDSWRKGKGRSGPAFSS